MHTDSLISILDSRGAGRRGDTGISTKVFLALGNGLRVVTKKDGLLYDVEYEQLDLKSDLFMNLRMYHTVWYQKKKSRKIK